MPTINQSNIKISVRNTSKRVSERMQTIFAELIMTQFRLIHTEPALIRLLKLITILPERVRAPLSLKKLRVRTLKDKQ